MTSLSVADLLTSFSLIWLAIEFVNWRLARSYSWLYKFATFIQYACTFTSIWNLGGIAVNRLIQISRPSLYKKVFTSWKLAVLVAIPWIVPGVIIPYFTTGNAISDLDIRKIDIRYHSSMLTLGWSIPIIAIICSYAGIYIYLKQYFKNQRHSIVDQRTRGIDLPRISNVDGRVIVSKETKF